jgi:hypothetical protein
MVFQEFQGKFIRENLNTINVRLDKGISTKNNVMTSEDAVERCKSKIYRMSHLRLSSLFCEIWKIGILVNEE